MMEVETVLTSFLLGVNEKLKSPVLFLLTYLNSRMKSREITKGIPIQEHEKFYCPIPGTNGNFPQNDFALGHGHVYCIHTKLCVKQYTIGLS